MSVLTKAVSTARKEINIPDTFPKDEEFESYVHDYLFPKDRYTLLNRTYDYLPNKDGSIYKIKEPDFKFRSASGKTFFVEAKYQGYFFDGVIEWCKYYQLSRYREINLTTPVYVVIGIGAQPHDPEQLYLLPLKVIKYDNLFRSFLRPYEIPAKTCICENQLI